ncbi:MAG: TIGR00730 family Rossman fold protein [Albidovulum sp.]|nr:TIGR00730 family Rossman fold protein [Albidovulum sp.]MDE0303262.1 TIGR00730 family Rossman fold protein [Albidovulum sp.]
MQAKTHSICVFCGSRTGRNPEYAIAAKEFGTELAMQGWRLVYGAGDIGLMGEVARAAQCAGGKTFGVIPKQLVEFEVAKHDLDSLVVTENMHERKSVMFMNSDAFVVLPGGVGTIDEFVEILTWRHLGFHTKPVGLLNIGGYWDLTVRALGGVVEKGFTEFELLSYFEVLGSVAESIGWLRDKLALGDTRNRP